MPHAGLAYSGPTAAMAFARLIPCREQITCVVLVGPAHRVPVPGLAAAPDATRLRTPLGDVVVDTAALARAPGVVQSVAAHAREHSLEVELPFLQRVTPQARVVPLLVGGAGPDEVDRMLEALWGGPETVVVVSSDLSHEVPYEIGRARDERTAARVLALDETLACDDVCAASAVDGLLRVARRKSLHAELLDLRSSGDATPSRDDGDRAGRAETRLVPHCRTVVGYGAFAFGAQAPARR